MLFLTCNPFNVGGVIKTRTLLLSTGPLTVADLSVGQRLQSSTSTYSILEFIGEGFFGKVAKCRNVVTRETVAVKLLKDTEAEHEAEHEVCLNSCFIEPHIHLNTSQAVVEGPLPPHKVSMLKCLSVLDPGRANLVQFYGQFEHRGLTCLAFEMLDTNLYDFIKARKRKPLSVQEIRPIAQQVCTFSPGNHCK